MLIYFPTFSDDFKKEEIILDIIDPNINSNFMNKNEQKKAVQQKELKAKENLRKRGVDTKQDIINMINETNYNLKIKNSRKDKSIDLTTQKKIKDFIQKSKEIELKKEPKHAKQKHKELEIVVGQQNSIKSKSLKSIVDKEKQKKKSDYIIWSNRLNIKSLKPSSIKEIKNIYNYKNKNIYDDIREINQAITSLEKYNNYTLTASQEAAIKSHVGKFWYIAPFNGSAKINDIMRVRIIVSLNIKGEIIDIKTFSDKGSKNENYQAFLESAVRAMQDASPLPGLYKDQYDMWKNIEFIFDSSGIVK